MAQKEGGMQLPHGANELDMIIDVDMIIDACRLVGMCMCNGIKLRRTVSVSHLMV